MKRGKRGFHLLKIEFYGETFLKFCFRWKSLAGRSQPSDPDIFSGYTGSIYTRKYVYLLGRDHRAKLVDEHQPAF